uniref:Uncharacterized protein n=1 Tax=Glossina pallidipes TaxID=7398 RepID=A0A1A9ZR73_GLOPL
MFIVRSDKKNEKIYSIIYAYVSTLALLSFTVRTPCKQHAIKPYLSCLSKKHRLKIYLIRNVVISTRIESRILHSCQYPTHGPSYDVDSSTSQVKSFQVIRNSTLLGLLRMVHDFKATTSASVWQLMKSEHNPNQDFELLFEIFGQKPSAKPLCSIYISMMRK